VPTFNETLIEAGFDLRDIRLLRHTDQREQVGTEPTPSPYELWCDQPEQWDRYNETHGLRYAHLENWRYWASFLATPGGETMFVGIYEVHGRRPLEQRAWMPGRGFWAEAGTRDLYTLTLDGRLRDLIGRLYIDWGDGQQRVWAQRADRQDKRITRIAE